MLLGLFLHFSFEDARKTWNKLKTINLSMFGKGSQEHERNTLMLGTLAWTQESNIDEKLRYWQLQLK